MNVDKMLCTQIVNFEELESKPTTSQTKTKKQTSLPVKTSGIQNLIEMKKIPLLLKREVSLVFVPPDMWFVGLKGVMLLDTN